ncbi:NAD(P)-dependent oxidoreductase [Mammaliicoccus vitulinus]|uniref:NAD(P)-dependent oxidoreductase n=1 Tax=Mammaliicoccus vitulinus TaxID=71237 RepID=A0A2T4PVM8_9STAP|nr:NAD(P)-dependent oxidoreductase [Mammaliicoccus vitulinus]MBO3078308.1 NAD(P)-dependent oxidoreductase [Mammaliicoccus vitulinus]PNZ36772.1 NADH-flavin reductase [Mammaliicoccus vitulinus]PTI30499.1 NAD(P)-dependent oxidoreductase [Mammaliicoccus vitulinus]PTI89270.1 NAD(P)-dependent oxidoreductase [Mammaliicoccus vitulinus]QQT15384.1 NAD(P)-dependent oxidoreductase [Mammaliicoccus vitulinus]
MKIGVIAANGKSGKLITEEAVNRGLDVTAIVRKENKTVAPQSIIKDIFDLTTEDLTPFDIVVDAFGEFREDKLHLHQDTIQHLSDILAHTNTRLIVVGGAGSLYVDDQLETQLYNTADFPEAFKPLATSQGKALEELRKRDDVRWTFISPAAEFIADGKRTGDYILAGEQFTLNSKGESKISYADYAIALIDEATEGTHIQERISVVSK